MKKTTIAMLALVAVLAGCKSEKTNNVEYYVENPTERAEKIKECRGNPGELEHTPNCQNAMAAQASIEFSSDNKSMPEL